jgi:hypothetical protein
MTAGLYLLAGPFQSERTGLGRLTPPWVVLTVYEFLVIGMIAVLHRRGIETTALTIVSLFFLVDPVFMGDAFASTNPTGSFLVNGAAIFLALLKAWALCRAREYQVTPWLAGWVAAAMAMIFLIPTLIAASATRPALNAYLPQAVTWGAAALAVPLARSRWLGWAAIAALSVHFIASGIVAQMDFHLELLTAPQVAAACLLPWPRLGWLPLPSALYCSPLRPRLNTAFATMEGMGWLLVAGAFLFLGVGFWRSLRTVPAPQPVEAPRRQPVA